MKRPMNVEHQSRQEDTTDVFYIDSIKFITLTKKPTDQGIIHNADMDALNKFFTVLKQYAQQSCVVEFNSNYFSLWQSTDKYLIFHPASSLHILPKCVQISTFDCLQKYVTEMFVDRQTEYSFHLVEFLKINDQLLSRQKIFREYYLELLRLCDTNITIKSDQSDFVPSKIPHSICLLPQQNSLETSAYEELTQSKDVLRCPKSVDRVYFNKNK